MVRYLLVIMAVSLGLAADPPGARAQTSSLYLTAPAPGAPSPVLPQPGVTTVDPAQEGFRPSPEVMSESFAAVRTPAPHKFAVNDLVTIVVREDTESASDSSLNTSKENDYNGAVSSFPGIRVFDMFTNQLLSQNLSEQPSVGINYKNQYKTSGDYSRKDTFTTRITAKIIDIKPNGTLVLEARKYVKSDDESLEIVLTGTCRKQDVAVDNTIQSTQLYDLHLDKEHTGELRNANKKGILSKLFDTIFNF